MKTMDLDQRKIIVLISIFGLSIGLGAITANYSDNQGSEKFEKFVNYTVDSEKDLETAEFDSRSVNLMYESSESAKMYLDIKRDGSFDRKLETVNDGEIRLLEELVTVENKSYRFYFRYQDNSSKSGDGYLTLYRIQQVI